MKLTNQFSIKKEVFLLGLVSSFAILLVFGFLLATGIYNIRVSSSRQQIRETNLQISMFTEQYFSEIINTIEFLADNHDVRNFMQTGDEAKERALALYQNVLDANKDILYVYSGHTDGLLLINDYIPPEGFDPRVRPWYLEALRNQPYTATGVPYKEANSDEWVIAPSRVLIEDDGGVSGVIAIDMTLDGIVEMLEQRHQFTTQRSFILDENALIIIHPDEDLIGETFTVFKDGMMPALSQGDLDYQIEGSELWAYYSVIDATGWIFVTDVERNEVLEPIIRQTLIYVALIVILAITIGLLMSKIFGVRFAEPLLELGDRVEAITRGKTVSKAPQHHSNYEIVNIAENIEKLAEHSLNKKANELQTIIESTNDGILVVDLKRNVIYVNSRFGEMWQVDQAVIESRDEMRYIGAVYDQLENPKAFFKSNEALYHTEKSETVELYFKDGRVFETYTTPLYDNGKLAGRLWSFRDRTDSKKAEQQIKYQNELFKLIADVSADFINTTVDNIDEKIDNMLARCGVFLGVDQVLLFQFNQDESYTFNTHEWVAPGVDNPPDVGERVAVSSYPWFKKMQASRRVIRIPDLEKMPEGTEAEKEFLREKGVKSMLAIPLKKGRTFLGYFGFITMRRALELKDERVEASQIMANILADALVNYNMEKELQQSNRDLARLSATDKLTQLFNRMKLDEVLENELARVKRNGPPFSVIIIDVDHFKAVNDNYGHHQGDQVLISLADILRSNLRVTDTYGRWGGEEFLIIAPNSSLDNGLQTAEKLRMAIEEAVFPSGIRITCSFGVTISKPEDSVSEILIRADQALYEAKNNGRNRVESAT